MIVFTRDNFANGHTYHFITGEATLENQTGGISWSEAQDFARSLSTTTQQASLLSIGSQQEEDWVISNFTTIDLSPSIPNDLIWIGLSDQSNEGDYVWSDGSPLNYSNWAVNSPIILDGARDFAFLVNTTFFEPFLPEHTWSNAEDSSLFSNTIPYAAIIEVTPIPEAESLLPFVLGGLGVLEVLKRKRALRPS